MLCERLSRYLNLIDENGDDLRAILDKAKARDPSGRQDPVEYVSDQQRQRRTGRSRRRPA